jgi:hypothetical protein
LARLGSAAPIRTSTPSEPPLIALGHCSNKYRVIFLKLFSQTVEVVTGAKSKGYRVVTVSFYQAEAQEADRLTDILQRAGWHKANRSLVIREAMARMKEELMGKNEEDVFRFFLERLARRASASVSVRSVPSDSNTSPY